jgi:hypothetical protein
LLNCSTGLFVVAKPLGVVKHCYREKRPRSHCSSRYVQNSMSSGYLFQFDKSWSRRQKKSDLVPCEVQVVEPSDYCTRNMRGKSFLTFFHVGHDVKEAHEVIHAGVVLEHREHNIHLALLGVSHKNARQEPQLGDPGVYTAESCKTALIDLLQPLLHNEERHQKTPRTIR